MPKGTLAKTGAGVHTMHEFVIPKVFLVFSQRTCPIHIFMPTAHVLGGFARFRCRKVPVAKTGFGVHTTHDFVLPKVFLVVSQRTCPIHFFRPETHVLGGLTRFRCRKVPVAKTVLVVHTMHDFVLPKVFLVFLQ